MLAVHGEGLGSELGTLFLSSLVVAVLVAKQPDIFMEQIHT